MSLLHLDTVFFQQPGEVVYPMMQRSHLSCILLSLLTTEFNCVIFSLVEILVCLDELVDLL